MPDKKERQKGNNKIAMYEASGNLLNGNSLWTKISNPEGILAFILDAIDSISAPFISIRKRLLRFRKSPSVSNNIEFH